MLGQRTPLGKPVREVGVSWLASRDEACRCACPCACRYFRMWIGFVWGMGTGREKRSQQLEPWPKGDVDRQSQAGDRNSSGLLVI